MGNKCTTGTCEKFECPEEKIKIRVRVYHDSIFTLGVYIRSSQDEKSWHDLRWFPKSRIDILTPICNVMEIAVPVWLLEKENIINLVKIITDASNK